ncbi:helix-turn-helix transcriptional regulator [Bacillus sp. N9]
MISLAKGYIQQHYEKSLTLEEVADFVQFSPHYFSKLLRNVVEHHLSIMSRKFG